MNSEYQTPIQTLKHVTLWAKWSQWHYMNKLGRGLLDDATKT